MTTLNQLSDRRLKLKLTCEANRNIRTWIKNDSMVIAIEKELLEVRQKMLQQIFSGEADRLTAAFDKWIRKRLKVTANSVARRLAYKSKRENSILKRKAKREALLNARYRQKFYTMHQMDIIRRERKERRQVGGLPVDNGVTPNDSVTPENNGNTETKG